MSCEGFTTEVEAATSTKEKVDAFAQLQTDGIHFCPRCGRMSVKDRRHTNTLSRHTSVYICDTCGMDEAVRDWKDEPLLLKKWAIATLPLVRERRGKPRRGIRRELQQAVATFGG